MSQNPSLETWLALDTPEFAAQTQALNPELALLMSIDGTRRHYLLNRPPTDAPPNFDDYAIYAGKLVEQVFDLLYAHGVKTVLNQVAIPLDFERPDNYILKNLKHSQRVFAHQFEQLYRKHNIKARLVGDWDVAPISAEIKSFLQQMQSRLIELTPDGDKLLLLGYQNRSFNQELIDRTEILTQKLGRPPSEAELRLACFPDGPKRLDALIGAGWLRVGVILPPLLDSGATDIYNLSYLALDLDAPTLRRILYDQLFRRKATSEHNEDYSSYEMEQLRAYYAAHQGGLIGLGRLVGPGIWYADHP